MIFGMRPIRQASLGPCGSLRRDLVAPRARGQCGSAERVKRKLRTAFGRHGSSSRRTVDECSDHWDGLKGDGPGPRPPHRPRPRVHAGSRLFYEKYPQYPKEAALATSDSVVVEVTPTRVFTWGLIISSTNGGASAVWEATRAKSHSGVGPLTNRFARSLYYS